MVREHTLKRVQLPELVTSEPYKIFILYSLNEDLTNKPHFILILAHKPPQQKCG